MATIKTESNVRGVAFANGGRELLFVDDTKRLYRAMLPSPMTPGMDLQRQSMLCGEHRPNCLDAHPLLPLAAAGYDDGFVRIFDTGATLSHRLEQRRQKSINAVRFSSSGRYLLLCEDKHLAVWDCEVNQWATDVVLEGGTLVAVDVSEDEHFVAAGTSKGHILLCRTDGGLAVRPPEISHCVKCGASAKLEPCVGCDGMVCKACWGDDGSGYTGESGRSGYACPTCIKEHRVSADKGLGSVRKIGENFLYWLDHAPEAIVKSSLDQVRSEVIPGAVNEVAHAATRVAAAVAIDLDARVKTLISNAAREALDQVRTEVIPGAVSEVEHAATRVAAAVAADLDVRVKRLISNTIGEAQQAAVTVSKQVLADVEARVPRLVDAALAQAELRARSIVSAALDEVNQKIPEFIDGAADKLAAGIGRAVQGNLSTALVQVDGKVDRQREAVRDNAVSVLDDAAKKIKRNLTWVAVLIAATNVAVLVIALLIARGR